VRLQLASTLVVSAILVVCMGALGWLWQRYLASQQSLRQVKMLAHDILASMDQGGVTTDFADSVTRINSTGNRLLGGDFECVGRPLACIAAAEVPLVELSRQVAERQDGVRDRDFTLNEAGGMRRLRADAHVLTDTQGTAVGCVIHLRDVTGRILMEERMRR